jgi:hypothetical protein
MNTQSNSSPLAGVHRHQLDGVLPGLGLVVAGLQRRMGQEGGQRGQGFAGLGVGREACARASGGASGSSPWLTGLCVSGTPSSSTGSATASRPKPSWVTKLSAALTSSSRFSMRSAPSLSAL